MSSIYGLNFSNFYLGRFRDADKTLAVLEGLLPEGHALPSAIRVFSLFQSGFRGSPQKRIAMARRARAEFEKIAKHQENHSLVALSCVAIDSLLPPDQRGEHDHDPHECFKNAMAVQERAQPGTKGMGLAPALFHELAGVIFLELDLDLAFAQAQLALKAKPGSHLATFTLGAVAAHRSDIPKAMTWLMKAHRLAPDSPAAIAMILDIKESQPTVEISDNEICDLAEHIAKIFPDDLNMVLTAGRALLRGGSREKATVLLNRGREQALTSGDKTMTEAFERILSQY
jgi:hypothetical protein